MRIVYNKPHETFCIALFMTNCVVNSQIPTRQNQSVQKTPITICISAQPLPIWASSTDIDIAKVTLLPRKLLYLAGKV